MVISPGILEIIRYIMGSIKENIVKCTIPDGTTAIFGDTFRITNITIPASVKRIDNSAFDGLDLESIDVDVNNLDFYSEDNCLINKIDYKAGTKLIRGCKNSIIPSGIKTIEPHAFFGCKSLKSIYIPKGSMEKFKGLLKDRYLIHKLVEE